MFSFFIIFSGFESFCFIFIVEKDKSKVLEFHMIHFSYLEISSALFEDLPSNKHLIKKIRN